MQPHAKVDGRRMLGMIELKAELKSIKSLLTALQGTQKRKCPFVGRKTSKEKRTAGRRQR